MLFEIVPDVRQSVASGVANSLDQDLEIIDVDIAKCENSVQTDIASFEVETQTVNMQTDGYIVTGECQTDDANSLGTCVLRQVVIALPDIEAGEAIVAQCELNVKLHQVVDDWVVALCHSFRLHNDVRRYALKILNYPHYRYQCSVCLGRSPGNTDLLEYWGHRVEHCRH